MAIATFTTTQTLVMVECCNCGIAFGIPDEYNAMLVRTKTGFYCPAGHSQSYMGKTHDDELREAKSRASELAARNRTLANDNMDLAAKNKEHQARARKRAKAGMCGICKRTFANYKRHCDMKHPEKTKAK